MASKKSFEKSCSIGDPIFDRAEESINRPLAFEKSKPKLDIMERALNALPEIKPWLKDELKELANAVSHLKELHRVLERCVS